MNKNTLIIAGLVVVGFVAALVLLQQNQTTNSTNTSQNTTNTNSNLLSSPADALAPRREGPSITRTLVEMNNTIESCYVIHSGYVYLIPPTWADEHEGGSDEITQACGTDITEIFNNNEEHTSNASDMLNSFYLGNLTE